MVAISSGNSALAEHIRLRAPQDHGQSLQIPKLSKSETLVAANRLLLSRYPQELQSLRTIARQELVSLALDYSRRYCDVDVSVSDRIVMSGHQPTLFHPGVWFKNFALDAAAKLADATAINLVVDNDLCADVSVLCPQLIDTKASLRRVKFDDPDVAMPFEMKQIKNRDRFESFAGRLSEAVEDVVSAPIIHSLWPEVQSISKPLALPARIAAGRHRLEQKHGLQTLELPVGVLASSRSFAMFVQRLVNESKRFLEIYNDALRDYRNVNRIRSRSHPVPELEQDGRFCEVPFWIWTTEKPIRRRLFVCCHRERVDLTDREGWSVSCEQKNFAASFEELNRLDSPTFIRPRALATTMFSRLFASDLFLHGIGGAKYDQLNDEIIRQFFDIDAPKFMTMTATMKMPFDFESVSEHDVRQLEVQLRRLRFHPETKVPLDEDAKRKKWLIENPPAGSRKSWHDQIAAINERLFAKLEVRNQLKDQIANAKAALPRSKILGSREISFTLFPESLIEQQKALTNLH